MFFNTRSLFAAALVSACALEVSALDFKPITDPTQIIPPNGAGGIFKRTDLKPITDPTEILPGQAGQAFKRDAGPAPVDLLPIEHPTVLTHGRSLRRAVTGKEAFDPKNATTFYWGAYAGDNIYVANFTLSNPFDDEFILPVEQFAKELKSIKCGKPGAPMVLEFKDQDSYDYAESGWDWVNKEDINKFTLVTEPDQCYKGDNRSPYLVSNIVFDKKTLTANVKAEEKEWSEMAHTFDLHLRHQHVPRATVNATHPHLLRRENSDMDISHTFSGNLFNFAIDSLTTMGMALSADAEITTAGHIAADFDIQQKKILGIPTVPEDIKIKIQPQDVTALMKLTLHADGTLGKGIDWSMTPEIDIPIAALNIAKILQIGPFVTVGVHFGSSALSGTGDIVTGAKGSLSNDAEVSVQLRKPEENSFANWQPTIEKIDPVFSAEFTGDLQAWAELAIVIKAEAFGKWGYQAGVEAELPYFRADLVATKDPAGVCGTMKTIGIDVDASVGIDVSLQAGRVNAVADFRKDLFTTAWPLFTTCLAIGDDNAVVPTATETEVLETGTAIVTGTEVVETSEPTAIETEILDEPTATNGGEADIPIETDFPTATVTQDEPVITEMPSATDGADMPGKTIYKTIYITQGGDEASLPEETEIFDEPTSTGDVELPEETGDVLPTETFAGDLPEETLPAETLAADLPEETLPVETLVATETAPLEEAPLETGPVDSMLPVETSDPTAPIETDVPTASIVGMASSATGFPLMNSTIVSLVGTVPPSTFATLVASSMAKPFTLGEVNSLPTPPPSPPTPSIPTAPAKPEKPSVPAAPPKPEKPSVEVPDVPKPSVAANAPSYSYRFVRRS